MRQCRPFQCSASALLAVLCCTGGSAPGQQQLPKPSKFPNPEKLTYRVEWRTITAGAATLELSHGTPADWETKLNIESAGLVTRLYRVLDSYKATSNDKFCGADAVLDAQEGKRHIQTRLKFDNDRHRATYDERNLLKNSSTKKELAIAPCTYEITGALVALRDLKLEPGKSAILPITDGKKIANARVEAQARETITLRGKQYSTIRHEAFLFDNVLYKRKGRLLIWITDDADHIPVQFRLQMGFPIGNITVELEKNQRL
jgi:hypothetical protein